MTKDEREAVLRLCTTAEYVADKVPPPDLASKEILARDARAVRALLDAELEPPRGKAVNQPCIIESDWPETAVIYAVCGPTYSCPTREDAERVKADLEDYARRLRP